MPEFALGLASSRDIWAAVACREAIQLCPADSPQTEPGLAVVLASKGTSKQILATEGAGREGTQAKGQKLPPFLEGSQASCCWGAWNVPSWVPTLGLVLCSHCSLDPCRTHSWWHWHVLLAINKIKIYCILLCMTCTHSVCIIPGIVVPMGCNHHTHV